MALLQKELLTKLPIKLFLLHVHFEDVNEDLLPFICYYNAEDCPVQTFKARELSEKCGFKYVISYP